MRQDIVASTLELYRNAAVGFIGWLGDRNHPVRAGRLGAIQQER